MKQLKNKRIVGKDPLTKGLTGKGKERGEGVGTLGGGRNKEACISEG